MTSALGWIHLELELEELAAEESKKKANAEETLGVFHSAAGKSFRLRDTKSERELVLF